MKTVLYCGRPKPLVAVGEHQCRMLEFASKYPGWHYYNKKCRATRRAIQGLHKRGTIELNEFDQFRLAQHSFVG